ncbi:MAG: hypothetical protein EBX17_02480, partial [Betaproteobacteria bacterium]|nr:hypothetical protein [Betaproteobacteria bacterium]
MRSEALLQWQGTLVLLRKEVIRFRKVSVQTVLAPVLSAVLFLIVFQHVLAGRMNLPGEMSYAAFLVPGLAMMALQQNAFANSSSSLTQSKVTGNLVFLLLTPLPAWSWFVGYVGGGVVRGLVVGLAVWLSTLPFVWTWPVHPGYALAMLLIAAVLMSALGLLAGLWADKWDQLSLFQSFLINPLSFLAGVFYSVQSLQEPWKQLAWIDQLLLWGMIRPASTSCLTSSRTDARNSPSVLGIFTGGKLKVFTRPAQASVSDSPATLEHHTTDQADGDAKTDRNREIQ